MLGGITAIAAIVAAVRLWDEHLALAVLAIALPVLDFLASAVGAASVGEGSRPHESGAFWWAVAMNWIATVGTIGLFIFSFVE